MALERHGQIRRHLGTRQDTRCDRARGHLTNYRRHCEARHRRRRCATVCVRGLGTGPIGSAILATLLDRTTRRQRWHVGSFFPVDVGLTDCVRYVGYGNSVVGTLVANEGFIRHFATVTDANGEPALDANHISIWGAVNYVAQIVVLTISPITSDRWGRKFNMYAFTFFLTIVRLFSPPPVGCLSMSAI